MDLNSFLTHFECSHCTKRFPTHANPAFCQSCKAPLLARYDLSRLGAQVSKDKIIAQNSSGILRWKELLPLENSNHIISLGEGNSPLLHLSTLSTKFGFDHLYLKDEGRNPSGSFKARGFSVAVSKAIENQHQKLILPSAGNAGSALAIYAARANIQAKIIMPKSTPMAMIAECKAAGAEVILIDGSITDCGMHADEIAMAEGWHLLSTFKEPYRLEGKKTMGYELAVHFHWETPSVIIFPTGGGTGLVGIWKAFTELIELGWITNKALPKMVAVQASGCAPLVRAFLNGADVSEPWPDPYTIASGLQVPSSFASRLILKIIRETSGYCIAVEDTEIIKAQRELGQVEGLAVSPEGAASLAGAIHLLEKNLIQTDDIVVIFNTASAVKYMASDRE